LPRASLTSASVEKVKPPKSGQIEYYDRRMPAFGLRLSYRGAKSWFIMTRIDGRLVRVTLGRYPALSLAGARDEARKATTLSASGKDPRLVRAASKEKQSEERRNTFGVCAEEFMEKYASRRLRSSTQREYRRILSGRDTRAWRDRPISTITKRDVLDVIDAIDQRGSPGASKRSLVYLRRFFNWCAERELIGLVPTDRIQPPHPEVKRDRVLTEDELHYLLCALEAERTLIGPAIRLLLLTGQRRAEVAGMRWSEIRKLHNNDAIWEIPGQRTKNKHMHLVPFSSQVRAIILGQARVGDLIFSTTGKTPVSGFGKAKARLDKRINEIRTADNESLMPAWTLHDLRRTMVTMMNERLGVAPHVVESVVNHVSGLAKAGVAGVYNRALYLEDRRTALTKWADFLSHVSSD
jgi:integrase